MAETKIDSSGVTFPDGTVQAFGVRRAIKTSDETVNNSATLQNDDHLLVAAAAQETVFIMIHLKHISQGTADIDTALSLPSGAGCLRFDISQTPASMNDWESEYRLEGTGGVQQVVISVVVDMGSTAGNIQLQWAQGAAEESDAIIYTNSFLLAFRLL